MSTLHEFTTWEPLLHVLRSAHTATPGALGGHVAGRIGTHAYSVPMPWGPMFTMHGQASDEADRRPELDAVQRVRGALAEAGADGVSFVARMSPDGPAVLDLLDFGPAVEAEGSGPLPGALVLVEDAVPEPWRRVPDPVPGAKLSPAADPAALESFLRDRLPDSVGATEAELAEAEVRLGVALPDELKALYRVTRARWEDCNDDYEAAMRVANAVGCQLFPLDELYIADAASRQSPWRFAAMKAEAVDTRYDTAVQGLVGSPRWIVFGDWDGDRIAVDLTPGPGGHTGQVIVLSREESVGAGLIADSLTELVLPGQGQRGPRRRADDEPPAVAHVNIRSLSSVEAAAHPTLEVLSIGLWEGEPLSLEPVVDLPRLRTLRAESGTLAAPLEISRLTRLEFLELCPQDWRVLLDADAVPRSLLAAGIEVRNDVDPLPVVDLANEILARWDRPLITRTTLEGSLGPVP
ncbi:SMI1/KNR4 family protein [Streptomyces albiflavescens]|uniref:SMI1/KNR4 family protein n=1 Tax=Streptomyces albiflavescens TaxID=1623582 RepID=A0A918D8R2_9ACTN|nr:SMI1/KNR4 family protein [Streptomyces albiflavescens]GGN81753.1 SMI1/KNR4 family protein [Streptomyces albiflavescens]